MVVLAAVVVTFESGCLIGCSQSSLPVAHLCIDGVDDDDGDPIASTGVCVAYQFKRVAYQFHGHSPTVVRHSRNCYNNAACTTQVAHDDDSTGGVLDCDAGFLISDFVFHILADQMRRNDDNEADDQRFVAVIIVLERDQVMQHASQVAPI